MNKTDNSVTLMQIIFSFIKPILIIPKTMKSALKISIALFFIVVFNSCQQNSTYNVNGWEIEVNAQKGTLSFTKSDMGPVIRELHLWKVDGKTRVRSNGLKSELKSSSLYLSVEKPEHTEWIIQISDTTLNFSCTGSNGYIEGIAPAGEKRIPARVSRQDNDVMFTQMGFVSATNIYHLFDMNTDILIGFPKGSKLTRNKQDNQQMNVHIALTEEPEITLTRNYYTNVVGLADNQKTKFKPSFTAIPDRFKTAPTGWSSWYCYYMSPTGESLMEETKALAKKLKPYGLKYVQLDAAYSRGAQANWLDWNKDLYPNGGKAWFKYVIDNGLTPGLWLNIHGANYARPSMADKYPENYFLKDKNGKLSPVCCSADKTVARLDYSNPEVIEKHLKPLFETLVNEWGLGYLKAGGWGTWMDFFDKNRATAFNPDIDSREIYRKAMGTVRNVMGDKGYLLGCAMHEIGVGFDYFDGSRTGGDDYASWTGKNHWSGGMQTFFNSLFGAAYLNGISWWSDPDDVMIREPLTMNEGKTIVSTISLSGQAYVFSDYVAEFSKERLQQFLSSKYNIGWAKHYPQLVKPLPPEKLNLYKKTMPSMPIKAMDLYPYKTKAKCCPKPASFPKALDLKVNAVSGQYDVVSMYNWADIDTIRTLELDKDLGLDPDKDYLAFDFWNKKLIKVENSRIQEMVPRHGNKAILIRTALGHPQLLATSRHLTAAYSLQSLSWDEKSQTLSGVSKSVPGDNYSLYIFVPSGMSTRKTNASTGKTETNQIEDHLLELSFAGTDTPVEWSVKFKKL